jgi:hypothetical protein
MSFDTPDFDPKARERDNSRPVFFKEAVQNKSASEAEGRPVFYDREMVRILVPGDRLTESVQIVRDEHRQRWPREYAAFKANEEAPLNGTPISQLPGMTASQVEELKFMKVHTIEDLASLPDELLSKVAPMNGKPLREKAQRWIEAANGAAPMEKLAAENDQLRTMMSEMQARMEAMEKAQAAKPAAE